MTITVYIKPACVQCNATYRALDKARIEYDVIDITENAQARDYVMSLGYLQAPVVVGRRNPLEWIPSRRNFQAHPGRLTTHFHQRSEDTMTAAAFTFTPDADFVDRALDAELRRDSESVDRKLRTMLAALDDSLAGISDAREELHTLYTAPGTDTAEDVAAHDQDIATHLTDAARNLRAAVEILRSHRQLTSPRP